MLASNINSDVPATVLERQTERFLTKAFGSPLLQPPDLFDLAVTRDDHTPSEPSHQHLQPCDINFRTRRLVNATHERMWNRRAFVHVHAQLTAATLDTAPAVDDGLLQRQRVNDALQRRFTIARAPEASQFEEAVHVSAPQRDAEVGSSATTTAPTAVGDDGERHHEDGTPSLGDSDSATKGATKVDEHATADGGSLIASATSGGEAGLPQLMSPVAAALDAALPLPLVDRQSPQRARRRLKPR